MNKRSYAWLTGLFVLLGLMIGIILLVTVRGPGWLDQGYQVHVELAAGNGLSVGSPVKFAGVDVGEIRNIRVRSQHAERPIELTLWIRQEIELYEDDHVLIGLLGILGEKYIEILPGDERQNQLKPEDRLIGIKPITEVELTQQMTRTLVEFETALRAVNQLNIDPQHWLVIKAQLESMLEQAQVALVQTQSLITQLQASTAQVTPVLAQWQIVGETVSKELKTFERWGPWVLLGGMALLAISLFI